MDLIAFKDTEETLRNLLHDLEIAASEQLVISKIGFGKKFTRTHVIEFSKVREIFEKYGIKEVPF